MRTDDEMAADLEWYHAKLQRLLDDCKAEDANPRESDASLEHTSLVMHELAWAEEQRRAVACGSRAGVLLAALDRDEAGHKKPEPRSRG